MTLDTFRPKLSDLEACDARRAVKESKIMNGATRRLLFNYEQSHCNQVLKKYKELLIAGLLGPSGHHAIISVVHSDALLLCLLLFVVF